MKRYIQKSLILIIILILGIQSAMAANQEADGLQVQEVLYFPLIQRIFINQIPTTRTPRPPRTATPTRTRVPPATATPRFTASITPTPTLTPTNTPTPTRTPTTTLIPLVSITIQFPTLTPTVTPVPTSSPTPTPGGTPSPVGLADIPQNSWLVILLVAVLWVILAAWLYLFLRQRRKQE